MRVFVLLLLSLCRFAVSDGDVAEGFYFGCLGDSFCMQIEISNNLDGDMYRFEMFTQLLSDDSMGPLRLFFRFPELPFMAADPPARNPHIRLLEPIAFSQGIVYHIGMDQTEVVRSPQEMLQMVKMHLSLGARALLLDSVSGLYCGGSINVKGVKLELQEERVNWVEAISEIAYRGDWELLMEDIEFLSE
jgi:hypothetical protein